jgi:beta-mannosidase
VKKQLLIDGWWIRQVSEDDALKKPEALAENAPNAENGWVYAGIADQVQKVLLDHKMIHERVAVGETERCRWIEEKDWLYCCDFSCDIPADGKAFYLNFGGVDLFADFYLNGKYIGSHDDMLIPKRINVSGLVHKQNRLLVYFHSTRNKMDEIYKNVPEEIRKNTKAHDFLRKGQIEFGDAGKVSMINVGLFEDVMLEVVDRCEITWPDIVVRFDNWYRWADIRCTVNGSGNADCLSVKLSIADPDGNPAGAAESPIEQNNGLWAQKLAVRIENPRLWWPKNYGGQPLYNVRVEVLSRGEVLDFAKRRVGLRRVEKTGDMRFRVNGREIKQWGALLEPFTGLTHRWDAEKCRQMLELTDHCNINTLRIWGGSMQFGDEFYEECDRRGIMVWQEFCLSWNPAPDTEEYSKKYRAEAEYEVKRVKHHACVLLYSGGNESLVGLIEGITEKLSYGWKPFMEDFKEVCSALDPDRFYLYSSPCGGDYPSDPREGDTHPLYYTYRHAVVQYPLFVSEQARSTTGPLRSLRRFMSDEELWPDGYVNQVTHSQYNPAYNVSYPDRPYYQYDPDYRKKYNVGWSVPQLTEDRPFMVTSWKKVPVPETWWRRAASFFASECSPLERFFDAENIYELIYRINAATAWFFKDDTERIRRGKPHYELGEPRRCQGYIYVKLNDTWPQFYCTLIDFFQEVHIPYYQYRRSLSPILLSFDFQDRIFLWGVNDTLEEVRGKLEVKVFSQIRNRVVNAFDIPVSIESGESKVLTDLDRVCPIVTECAVQAKLYAEDGRLVSVSDTLVDLERHQSFPRARLTLRTEGDELIVTTDKYAHCVEITGNEDGDEFNWYFEDNYFNLFPYEEKRVKIMGKHKKGVISAKAHYSDLIAQAEYRAAP